MQVQQLGHWRQLAHEGGQHPETFIAKFETANQIPLRHVSPDSRGKGRKMSKISKRKKELDLPGNLKRYCL